MYRSVWLLTLFLLVDHCLVRTWAEGDWAHQVRELLSASRFSNSVWGVELLNINSGKVLFATNEHAQLKPASNQKLFCAAWALDQLDPKSRISTLLRVDGSIDHQGILHGDLRVIGGGDPTWGSDRDFTDATNQWTRLLGLIRAANIKKITGRLIGDISRTSGSRWGTNRLNSDLIHAYGAEISALNERENVVTIQVHPSTLNAPTRLVVQPISTYLIFTNRSRTVSTNHLSSPILLDRKPTSRLVRVDGTIPINSAPQSFQLSVPSPAEWFLHTLRKKLNEENIVVLGSNRVDSIKEEFSGSFITGTISSPSLSELTRVMLKESQNLYAECIFRFVGESLRDPLTTGSTSEHWATLKMTDWLGQRGIERSEILIEDGSGLSRGNRASAHAFVTLLRWSNGWRHRELFQSLLPAPGVDGTLKNRFKTFPMRHTLRAKTGSLNGVASLSGFMKSRQGDPLVFSVILNNHQPLNGKSAREEVDDLVELLGTWSPE